MSSRFRMRRIFPSLLASYAVMMVLPCIFTILMYRQSLLLSEQSCVDECLAVLRKAQTDMDERLDLMDKASMQLVYDVGVKSIMYYERPKPAYPHVYQLLTFCNKLYDKLSVASDDLNGYRLFLKDNELVFYNNAVTVGLEFYYEKSMNYQDMQFEEWHRKMFTPVRRTLLPSSGIKLGQKTVRAMTYIFPLTKAAGNESGGVIQFLISDSFIDGIMSPASIDGSGSFYLIDAGGALLYAPEDACGQEIDIDRFDSPEGYFHNEQDHAKNIMVYTRSPQSGLVFAALLPERVVMEKAINVKHTALAAIAFIVLAELVMCVSLAWRNATPVINFIRNLRAFLTEDGSKIQPVGEYDYLEKSIPRLQTMHSAMKEKERLERKYFLDQVLEGRFKSREEIMELGSSVGLKLDAAAYCVAALEVTEPIDKVQSLLEQRGEEKLFTPLLYHVFEENILIALYGFAEPPDEKWHQALLDGLAEQNRIIEEKLGFSCSIGVGKTYVDITDVCFSYSQSRYCATHHAVGRGGRAILEYESIPRSVNTFYFPVALEHKLINATRHRETAQIENIFFELEQENIRKRRLSRPMAGRLAANLESALLKAYEDIVFDDHSAEDAVNRVSKHTSLTDTLKALQGEFLKVAGREENRISARHTLFRQSVEAYIRQNYDNPDLSVTFMAQHFRLSDSYFSQLFKDVLGEPFSGYLETVRLEKARELILGGGLDIEQIALRVGYSNSTTFRRAFKRVEGVSPITYKSNASG